MQRITIWRRLSQAAFFLFTGEWLAIGWLRCPFGVPFVSCLSCPLPDCPGRPLFAWLLGGIAVAGALVRRAFCGWACPMGFVEDLLGKLPKPRWPRRKWFAALDRRLKPLRYVSLAVGAYLVLRLNYPVERPHAYVVRNESVFDIRALQVAWDLGARAYEVRAWILVAALLITLLVTRAWCRYLCPFGALFGLTNRISLLQLGRDVAQCRSCGRYPRECPQHTTPGTTDCTICGECIQGCAHGAVAFEVRYGSRTGAEPAWLREDEGLTPVRPLRRAAHAAARGDGHRIPGPGGAW